jgi:hypothetical protein
MTDDGSKIEQAEQKVAHARSQLAQADEGLEKVEQGLQAAEQLSTTAKNLSGTLVAIIFLSGVLVLWTIGWLLGRSRAKRR